jgi:hypothetical protein
MRRRNFTKAIASSAIAWPLAARAQQPDMVRRIGVLMGPAESDPDAQVDIAAFRQGLLTWPTNTAKRRNLSIALSKVQSPAHFRVQAPTKFHLQQLANEIIE